MMAKGTIFIAALALMMVTGCGGGNENKSAAADGNAADAVASARTGVAECDRLFNEIKKCIAEDVPAEQREALAAGFKQSEDLITKMAIGNEDTIAKSCNSQRPQLKQQYCPK